jgi:hypothetical protein
LNINELTSMSDPANADLLAVWDTDNSTTKKVSISALAATILAGAVATDDKTTQYSAPSASPFTVAVTDSSASIWLVLTPTGTLALGTITLPAVANAVDRQEVLVNTTQEVTGLTVAGNGATAVTGAPTTLAANAFFRMRYEAVTKTWYRVG